MSEKQRAVAALREEFERWEALLAGLSPAQLDAPLLSDGQSVKDTIGHLHGWQQLSVARFEAARLGREPLLPDWLGGGDPEAEEDLDRFNATIAAGYADQPWPAVHERWRTGYRRLLELAEATPEAELLEAGRYPWLNGYALIAVLDGSYEHHRVDHREPLLDRLRELDAQRAD